MADLPVLSRGTHLPDVEKRRLGEKLLREYDAGKSIRQLCADTGYSIGRVRRLLEGVNVRYRDRGGRRKGTTQP